MDEYRPVRVVGVLARAPGLPIGDVSRSLTITCHLTREGRLDDEAWRETADQWMAFGSLPGRGPIGGRLARQDDLWVLRMDGEEEAPQWLITSHCLRPGEYFTLRGADSEEDFVFRVVNVVEAGTGGDTRPAGSPDVTSGNTI